MGEFMNKWKEYKVSEMINIIGGGTPKTKVSEYWDGDIPWLSVKDFNTNLRKVYDTEKCITQKGLENSSTKLLDEGDIIISARGTVGALAQLGKTMAFNQSCYGLRAKEMTTNDFVYYLLKNMIGNIQQNTHGSVFDTITRDTFDILKANLPPIQEQKAIAHILTTLDDKIEINNQINKTLENMAQAIFKQWFVDFEFPNEEGEPYKSSGGEMVESELGMIPKNWEVVKLETVCREITRGFTSKYVEKSRFKNLNQKVNKGEMLEKQYYKFLREDIEIPQNKFVKKYDILLNSLGQGTLGRLHFFIEDEENVVIDQHITIIRADHETSFDSYLYHLLSSSKYNQIFDGLVSGSTGMQMLNISKVRNLTVYMAPVDLQKEFDNRIKTLYKKKENLLYENEYLKLIRDALLPKLMSGEIRVPMDEDGEVS